MSLILKRASAVSMAASLLMVVFSAMGSGAAAQDKILNAGKTDPVQLAAPAVDLPADPAAPKADIPSADLPIATLADLVAAHSPQFAATDELTDELQCLAGAIYFEARNESLNGQLAVGRVVVARAQSGRFPPSYCGVVKQPSQFAFVHHATLPAVNTASASWRRALAIAHIAHRGMWKSPAEGALYFHAARAHPRWTNAVKIAQIENHIFYR